MVIHSFFIAFQNELPRNTKNNFLHGMTESSLHSSSSDILGAANVAFNQQEQFGTTVLSVKKTMYLMHMFATVFGCLGFRRRRPVGMKLVQFPHNLIGEFLTILLSGGGWKRIGSNPFSDIERRLLHRSRSLLLAWQLLLLPVLIGRGGHEPEVSSFVSKLHGELFVDVGANIGFYTRLLKDNFRRIVAVEADPLTCAYLRKYKPRNCDVVDAAVSDEEGFATLYSHPTNPGGSSVAYGYNWKPTRVRKITLTRLLSTESQADLVKVDVEGAESLVLKGAAPIMRKIRSWIIECHDVTQRSGLASQMTQYGYTCRWLDQNHAYFSRQPSTRGL